MVAPKLDILVFAAHPDDAELSCSGTILASVAQGKKVGVIDLTQGEMGTRGTIETRYQEAEAASKILGLTIRENLKFKDVYFKDDEIHRLAIVQKIRQYQPDVVLANALFDRHPDHGKGGDLVSNAVFWAGLRKIETFYEGRIQEPFRPAKVFRYIQDRYIHPQMVMDITPFWNQKLKSILCYSTQFHNPQSLEPETWISTPHFLKFVEARGREMGHSMGFEFGEGFTLDRPLGVKDLNHLY